MPPPSDTRLRLVDAAIELIELACFGAVSVEQICERADARKGSFYHYFPSKVDLALEALETAWKRESHPRFERIFRPEVPPLERLTALATELYVSEREAFAATGHVRGCPLCTVGLEMANQDQRLRAKTDELIERDLIHIERALREAQAAGAIPAADFESKTRALAALVLGTKLQAKLRNDPELLRDLGRQMLEFVGARAPHAASARASIPRKTSKASAKSAKVQEASNTSRSRSPRSTDS
jgi:TetR/AcrR family transcriptional repressor of nem operon